MCEIREVLQKKKKTEFNTKHFFCAKFSIYSLFFNRFILSFSKLYIPIFVAVIIWSIAMISLSFLMIHREMVKYFSLIYCFDSKVILTIVRIFIILNFSHKTQSIQWSLSFCWDNCFGHSFTFSFIVNMAKEYATHSRKLIIQSINWIGIYFQMLYGKCFQLFSFMLKMSMLLKALEVFHLLVIRSNRFVSKTNFSHKLNFNYIVLGCQFGVFVLLGTSSY